MSQENVEVVRRVYELFRRGDYRAALAYFDPDVETIEPAGMPGGASYFGHAGVAEAFVHFADAWASYTVEIEQLTEAGDRVVAIARYHATGRESGVVVETTVAHVYAFDNGRIARWEMFNTRDEALEAVGSRSRRMPQENMEIVRLAYAAVNAGDLDALAEVTAPNAILDLSRSIGPQKGIYRGREELGRYLAGVTEAFERFQLAPVDFVVGPAGEIVVRHHVSARGRASGLELDTVPDVALVWELRDGKVIKTTMYQPHTEALEAVGLRE